MRYGIEVGRWSGPFALNYYADVFSEFHNNGSTPMVSVSAFTKKGALKRAIREINKVSKLGLSQIYYYDVKTKKLNNLS